MSSFFVVFAHPAGDGSTGLDKIQEPVLIETFIAHPAVEAFGEAVLHRLAGIDEI